MMRLLSSLLLLTFVAACNSAGDDVNRVDADPASYAEYDRYGDDASIERTVAAADIGEDHIGREVAIEGTISEVCQNAGCWFVFQRDDASTIRVHVPKEDDEYEFTLPTEISGRHAVAHGLLETRELTVEEQDHYAGESESGEAAHVEYRLVARTVLVSPTA